MALNKDWRGRPISEVAARNAEKTRKELEKGEDKRATVARLNLRGVSALNRNDREAARGYFQKAYKMDADNAFALNNMGYLAEMEGDKETAQYYYERALQAQHASAKVAVSNRPEVEGRPVGRVAQQSDDLVEARLQAEVEAKRREATGKPALHTRDNRIIVDKPLPKTNQNQQQNPPQELLQNQPRPEELQEQPNNNQQNNNNNEDNPSQEEKPQTPANAQPQQNQKPPM